MSEERPNPLLETYLARRADLVRFFTLRTNSASEAEDLVQEMYLKISRAAPEGVENSGAYLYRLGSNLMLDRARTRRRAASRHLAYDAVYTERIGGAALIDEPNPDAAIDAQRKFAALLAAIEGLPPQRRRVFRLHKLEGLTQAETAQRLGISRGAVEKHVSAALKTLLRKLDDRSF